MQMHKNDQMQVAWTLFHQQQWKKVLQMLDSWSDPPLGDWSYWYIRGVAESFTEKHQKAFHSLIECMAINPENTATLYYLAHTYESLDQPEKAEETYLRALSIDPEDTSLLSSYSLLVLKHGQVEKADLLLKMAEELDPEDQEVISDRIMYHYVHGDMRKADAGLARLLELYPDSQFAHTLGGQLKHIQEQPRSALRRFKTSISLDPTDIETAKLAREVKVDSHWLLTPRTVFRQRFFIILMIAFGISSIGGLLRQTWIILLVGIPMALFSIYYYLLCPIIQRLVKSR